MKDFFSKRHRPIQQKEKPPAEFWLFFRSPNLPANPGLWESYKRWRKTHINEDFAIFQQFYNAKVANIKSQLAALANNFPNATKGKPYSTSIRLPEAIPKFTLKGLDKTGLVWEPGPFRNAFTISGIPACSGEFPLTLTWVFDGWQRGMPLQQTTYKLLINPDPAELWKNVPSNPQSEYWRPDQDFATLSCRDAQLLGASIRGRSHAHTGLARDDAFAIECCSGWQLLAVADGAGSAPFSRKGAALACEICRNVGKELMPRAQELENLFEAGAELSGEELKDARRLAYHILPHAALEANKAIRAEAEKKGRQPKEYATTLLLCLARRFSSGWGVLSFQIGDGAMAALTANEAFLLATPDEGEYGGQTRFVTMNEIFDAHELMRRLKVRKIQDLKGILLMTDGVSDAKMPSLEDLSASSHWQAIWNELIPLLQAQDPETGLHQWLNFWSKGNHDDRTIALLTPSN